MVRDCIEGVNWHFNKNQYDGHRRVELSMAIISYRLLNKSSAVAEMGDRLATSWAEKRGALLYPYQGDRLSSNTMWPGPRPTSVPIVILIHSAVCQNRHKPWLLCPFGGSCVPI